MEIRAFTDADVDAAARLLAERHERHRAVEPLLPAAVDFRGELEKERRADGASGVVALADDGLAGYLVGHLLLYRRPAGLRVPDDSIDLAQASTEPAERGSGVGVALTAHALAWAAANGFRSMTADWRMTNLLASRFWPRRGFRTTFLRLYRSIP